MAHTEAQLEQSQHELQQMRDQLVALQQKLAEDENATGPSSAAELAAAVAAIREQQTLQESQIATHEQSKVESESKYPVKLSGLVLLNGFVNTHMVDMPATPNVALPGAGSTGATYKQTVLGIDARGPHVFGARSHADLRVDFDGSDVSSSGGVAGAYAAGVLRMRTAHAELFWENTEAFFSLDHAIFNANTPSSLAAVSVPALAWSGNLWAWNPQAGVIHDFGATNSRHLSATAALIDVANPPSLYSVSPAAANTYSSIPSTAEESRWPGVESRIALVSAERERGLQIGIGGLFAPHRTPAGINFNSWAATLDYRMPITSHMELSGNAYRGMALGGLGGGAYKDYLYYVNPSYPESTSFRALDDSGGWAQLKAHSGDHLEFNFAFGTDQVPAGQLRPYAGVETGTYLDLARNRTYTGNFIYSPSAYLLFSLEYRRLESSPVNGATVGADIIGIATGYRF